MQEGAEPTSGEDTEKAEKAIKYAEELAKRIESIHIALARGDFADLKELLNEVKNCIAELEKNLDMDN